MVSIDRKKNSLAAVFFISFAALYLELFFIRWIAEEIRLFAYLKNLPLLASFIGLGIGLLRSSASDKLRFWHALRYAAPLLIALTALAPALGITFTPLPHRGDFFVFVIGEVFRGIFSLDMLRFLAVLVSFFILILVIFIGLGEVLGVSFRANTPLLAYGANLLGSVTGVLAFAFLSWLSLGPITWLVGALGLFSTVLFFSLASTDGALSRRETARRILRHPVTIGAVVAMTLTALTLLVTYAVGVQHYWSPYHHIHYREFTDLNPKQHTILLPTPMRPQDEYGGALHSAVWVNYDGYINSIDLSQPATTADSPLVESARLHYNLPYRVRPNPRRVLVLGAGTGNDVAAALRAGAHHVDAVEIDPVIARIGLTTHPEQPYRDPRVAVFVDDARAFLANTNQVYDVIIFGHLDSLGALSAFSSIRVENYMYTLEAFRAVANHLTPDGVLALSFSARDDFVGARMFHMLSAVFGENPQVAATKYAGDVSFFTSKTTLPAESRVSYLLDGNPVVLQHSQEKIKIYSAASLPPATDDWPFLYLKTRSVPFVYVFSFIVLLLVVMPFMRKTMGMGGLQTLRQNAFFFFLGIGFMLIETRSITALALLWGSTWVVNTVIIAAVLTMGFLANLLVLKGKRPHASLLIIGLGIALIAGVVLRPDMLIGTILPLRILIGGTIAALPLFFSGMLFSLGLTRADSVSGPLGANLLGAFIGGMLENASMIWGIQMLGVIAGMVYGCAFVIKNPIFEFPRNE